jgi:hypothetical protein
VNNTAEHSQILLAFLFLSSALAASSTATPKMRFEPPKLLAASDPSPAPAPNRLLALPREIRDMVYEYAPSEDQGILIGCSVPFPDPMIFKGYRPTEPSIESNQLKYVCHQLY